MKQGAWGRALGVSALALASGASAHAATLTVDLSLSEVQSGASYNRPYLAVWIENPQEQTVAATLTVWYDQRLRNNLGKMWLRHLRTWWRKAGEQLELPADGVSGATRSAGRHVLRYETGHGALARLPAGDYNLAIEVAREHGGREIVRAPFHWEGAVVGAEQTARAQGNAELGEVLVKVQP